jgi:hypothetical protein
VAPTPSPSNGLTAAFEIRRFIEGVSRNVPAIQTINDSCRDFMQIDSGPGLALSINDSRIVVGTRGGDAFEWFPSQCPNSVQSGSLPRLQPTGTLFNGATAAANNNTRDAVGFTNLFFTSLTVSQDVPTVWRKVNGGFTVQQLQTELRPAPLNSLRQPGRALDINESGTIVGSTRVGSSTSDRAAILFQNADPEIIRSDNAAADYVIRPQQARGISNNGYITGIARRYIGGGDFQTRGFIRKLDGAIVDTNLIDSDGLYIGAEAQKINNSGFAVGKMVKSDGGLVATMWNENGRIGLLTTFNVEDLPEGTVMTEALDINDHNDILAKGTVNGQVHAFILRRTTAPIYFFPESHSY